MTVTAPLSRNNGVVLATFCLECAVCESQRDDNSGSMSLHDEAGLGVGVEVEIEVSPDADKSSAVEADYLSTILNVGLVFAQSCRAP